MKIWLDPTSIKIPDSLLTDVGGHPVVPETLYRRGITTSAEAQQFMYWYHYKPTLPTVLPDMDKAVGRIKQAIHEREIICVWGDFDVDGQTSTALLVSALRQLSANVVSYIPQRLTEGHGIHLPSLARQIDGGAQLILTCDTGIDEHEMVKYANSRGVDIIITDHHKLPDELPDAYAAINPRRLEKNHPLRDLPGVGVAYLLINALAPQEDWSHLLDLVALGIVADVAVQRADTRYYLQRGLTVLRDSKRIGLQVMMELAEVNPNDLNEDDIGFRLAPRLNAIGRLSDANPTTTLLTASNLEQARILANQLEGLNAERQRLSDEVWRGVQAEISREPGLLKHAALVINHPDWHTGVVGIVANRAVEAYGRPVLLMASPDGKIARGSARSIAGVDITDAIADNRQLVIDFGGHTMAAGLAIQHENIDDFRRALSQSVRQQLSGQDITPAIQIDRYMQLEELDMPLVKDVARIAPFGAGNPPLTFATRGLTITSKRQLGRDAKHLKLTVEDDVGTTRQVVWWNNDEPPSGRFNLAYTVRENTFRGEKDILIEWLDYRQIEDDIITISKIRDIEFIDYRNAPDPIETFKQIHSQEDENLIVWGEAIAEKSIDTLKRHQLIPKPALAVWTIPPDVRTWQNALDKVQPERVYLFAMNPGTDKIDTFLSRLTGLVKYTLTAKNGIVSLANLAAMTAQNEEAVRVGLMWLAAKGQIRVVADSGGELRLEVGDKNAQDDTETAQNLKRLLDESAAYRAFWKRNTLDRLKSD